MVRYALAVQKVKLTCLLYLKEESQDLSSEVLAPSLLVVHDSTRGGHDNIAELSGRQQIVGPLFNVPDADVKPGRHMEVLDHLTRAK